MQQRESENRALESGRSKARQGLSELATELATLKRRQSRDEVMRQAPRLGHVTVQRMGHTGLQEMWEDGMAFAQLAF